MHSTSSPFTILSTHVEIFFLATLEWVLLTSLSSSLLTELHLILATVTATSQVWHSSWGVQK